MVFADPIRVREKRGVRDVQYQGGAREFRTREDRST
jgi:hypothetical protein